MFTAILALVSGCSTPPQLEVPPLTNIPTVMPTSAASPTAAAADPSPALSASAAPDFTPPKVLATPVSTYPDELRAADLAGRVVLSFTVGIDGRISDFHVVSSTDPRLTDFFLRTTDAWRYQPARSAGHPVPHRLQVPVRLELVD